MAKKTAKPVRETKTTAANKPAKRYVSPKTSLENLETEFTRADLIFEGVDHSGATFEARVFINNEAADEQTPTSIESGYAGSFHIFGHGGCFGDDLTHCQIRETPRQYDPRPAHPLTPARKVLIATDAIRQALVHGREMTVTVVPVVMAGTPKCDYENVLKFDRFCIVTYL